MSARRLLPVLLLALAAPVAAQQPTKAAPASPTRPRTAAEDLQLFGQVLNHLRVNHPDSLDTHELFMAAIEGMVRAADPHSYVIPVARLSPEKQKALEAGKLYPVPIAFTYVGGAPVVASVAPGSGAARLDILPGDELVAIDAQPVAARSAGELDLFLSGQKGTEVRLDLERQRLDGSSARLTRVVKRERVEEATAVPAALALDAQTGYLRLTTFAGERVDDDVRAALDRLEKGGMTQLVLDLRDNPGGRVDAAARIAGFFLPKGTLVYTSSGRKPELTDTGRVRGGSPRPYPVVLMINAGTASAAELLAGALQDHDRAVIYGRPSFGKSLIMQTFPLVEGSIAVLVTGILRTPCGRAVQRDYHKVSTHEYYRQARAERDTAGLPSCRTDAGRVVRGGGGIYPDVLGPEPEPPPLWEARLAEADVPLRWTGGYVSARGAALGAPGTDLRTLPAGAADEFRAFATGQGVTIPRDSATDAALDRLLLRWVARVRGGEEGYYRTTALVDPEVAAARALLPRAGAILHPAAR